MTIKYNKPLSNNCLNVHKEALELLNLVRSNLKFTLFLKSFINLNTNSEDLNTGLVGCSNGPKLKDLLFRYHSINRNHCLLYISVIYSRFSIPSQSSLRLGSQRGKLRQGCLVEYFKSLYNNSLTCCVFNCCHQR